MIQRSTIRKEWPFYIESDGKPMGETELHVLNIRYLLEPLDEWFASDPMVYVNSNMFIHYERGNRRRHVSPDVFVVRGVPKEVQPRRRAYFLWEEGPAPQFVIEFTSESTRKEDEETKRAIYQDILRVQEYFLFDPFEEYLYPRLQGYRLTKGVYRPIRPVKGRLPSKVLALHLEADSELLRLYDPAADHWLPIPPQAREQQKQDKSARERAEEARQEEARARREAEAEAERLRRENQELRRRLPGGS